eukprot:4986169-Pleurochrysis_carterae.AAC.1
MCCFGCGLVQSSAFCCPSSVPRVIYKTPTHADSALRHAVASCAARAFAGARADGRRPFEHRRRLPERARARTRR